MLPGAFLLASALALGQVPSVPDPSLGAGDAAPAPPTAPSKTPVAAERAPVDPPAPKRVEAVTAPAPAPTVTPTSIKVPLEGHLTITSISTQAQPSTAPVTATASLPSAAAATTTEPIHRPGPFHRLVGAVGKCLAKKGQPWVRLPEEAPPQTAAVRTVTIERVVYVPSPAPARQAVLASPQIPRK